MFRLPWRRNHREAQVTEATRARERAERQLEESRAQTAYYAALGASLKQLREANHLTELFFTNRHHTRGQS